MNEQQRLRLARVEFLAARRRYVLAMREAELAVARKAVQRTMPSYQADETVPALLRRQA